MSVTWSGNVIHMTATSDSQSGNFYIQAMECTGAVTVKDGDGNKIWDPGSAGRIEFPSPRGLVVSDPELDSGTGELYIYIL
jgi:hypothetical protein